MIIKAITGLLLFQRSILKDILSYKLQLSCCFFIAHTIITNRDASDWNTLQSNYHFMIANIAVKSFLSSNAINFQKYSLPVVFKIV